jgi:hypothetical protein
VVSREFHAVEIEDVRPITMDCLLGLPMVIVIATGLAILDACDAN